jgi:hypothetical protein
MHVIHLALLLGLAVPAAAGTEARAPAEDQFIVIPLRVHVLSAPDLALANCRLSDADVRRVIANLNAIWHPAGIRFRLESLLREPAAQRNRYRALTEKRRIEFGPPDVTMLLPRESRDLDGLHAYLFHQLPYNSSFLGDNAVVVQETANVRQVVQGGNDTIARVMAHALGRALAVPNSGDERSLMANGTSGVALDAREAQRARQVARTIPGAATVAEARMAVEAARVKAQAQAKTESAGARGPQPHPDQARRPAAQPADDPVAANDQFLIVPLRVHVLTAPDLDRANCRLTDADVARVLGNLNSIWHQARIHFGLETLCREAPDQRERFRITTDGHPGGFLWPERMLLPRSTRTFDGLHAYFFHELPNNGVYLGDDTVLVQEGAQVHPIQGGTGDPVARVTAHALAYALGLPDDPDPKNLMSQGSAGAALDNEQINFAHAMARTLPGVATVVEVQAAAVAAQSKGELAQARRLWSWLAEIPAPGAARAKRLRDKLDERILP